MTGARRAARPAPGAGCRSQNGFTLIELLLSVSLAVVIVGTAIALTADVQRLYARALDDTATRQEARYVLDWMARVVATAGSNPYGIDPAAAATCGGVPFAGLMLDPDGNGVHDDLRVQADSNPPNGVLVGDPAQGVDCDESGEDVRMAIDRGGRMITRQDLATDAGPLPATDAVFTDLRFTYFTAAGLATTSPGAIATVRIAVTAESRVRHPATGAFTRVTLQRDVRIRSR